MTTIMHIQWQCQWGKIQRQWIMWPRWSDQGTARSGLAHGIKDLGVFPADAGNSSIGAITSKTSHSFNIKFMDVIHQLLYLFHPDSVVARVQITPFSFIQQQLYPWSTLWLGASEIEKARYHVISHWKLMAWGCTVPSIYQHHFEKRYYHYLAIHLVWKSQIYPKYMTYHELISKNIQKIYIHTYMYIYI